MPAKPAWPPKSAPRMFVAVSLAAGAVVLIEGNPAHYLTRVMRAAPGDVVVLCDDVTGEWAARVSDVGKRDVTLRLDDPRLAELAREEATLNDRLGGEAAVHG